MQKKFDLLEGFKYYDLEKDKERKYGTMRYTPDFIITIKGIDKPISWETKGMVTTAYSMRKKLWYNLYGDEYYFIESSSMKHQRKVLDDLLNR